MLKKILKFIGMLFGVLLILSGIGLLLENDFLPIKLGAYEFKYNAGIGFIIAGLVINYLYWRPSPRQKLITLIVLLSISLDQISKIWVRNNFESYNETNIIGDIFTLIKVENTGAFLGMGSELSEIPRVFLLIILPVVVLISITIYTYIDKTLDKISIIGFSLIIGGGIANIFDRIVYGSVTDFLYINLGGIFKTGIFNIADLSVTTGMILILISSFKRRN
tara:strand:+ start:9313 stop:9975 length:663 start_codon:yes stop_codon:yes gene_type:complete